MSIHVIVMHDMLPANNSVTINGIVMGEKNTDKFAVDTIMLANLWGKDSQNPTDPDFELSPTPWAFDKAWVGEGVAGGVCLDMREDDACGKDVRSRENKRANAQDDHWRNQMTFRHVYCKDKKEEGCAPTQQIRIGNQYRLKQLTEGNVVVACGLNLDSKLFKPNAEGVPTAAEGGELAIQVNPSATMQQTYLLGEKKKGDPVGPQEWNEAGVTKVHSEFLDKYDLHFVRKVSNNSLIAPGDVMERDANTTRSVLVKDTDDVVSSTIVVTKDNWKTQKMRVQFSQGSWLPHIEEYHLKLVPKANNTDYLNDTYRYNVYVTCKVELDDRVGDKSTCIKEFNNKNGKKDTSKETASSAVGGADDEDAKRFCLDHKYRFEGNDDPMFWRVFGINQVQYQYVFDYGAGPDVAANPDTNGYPFVEAPVICRKKDKSKCQ